MSGDTDSEVQRGLIAASPPAVWIAKNVMSRLDRLVLRVFRGHVRLPTSLFVPTLVLTTRGRRTGEPRSTPLIYVADGADLLVANARPEGERRNPWVLNLRSQPRATVVLLGESTDVRATELGDSEIEEWWPEFVARWPAFEFHYAATGERAVFRLERSADRSADHPLAM